MKFLKNINEFLILEKRIGQITANVDVNFSFDIVKTKHTVDRQKHSERGLDDDLYIDISNAEMKNLVFEFIEVIAYKITTTEIENGVKFIIKSPRKKLSLVIAPENIQGSYWKLIIVTAFRESKYHTLKTGIDQLVLIEDDL